MTEDHPEGCLYRFTPEVRGDLGRGQLEVAVAGGMRLSWKAILDPSAASRSLRERVPEAARFRGG